MDVSKFSDTTPTDPDIKDCIEAQERAEKAGDFKDPGTLQELRDKVELDLLKCDNTDEARSKIDEIIRDTISSANRFNE